MRPQLFVGGVARIVYCSARALTDDNAVANARVALDLYRTAGWSPWAATIDAGGRPIAYTEVGAVCQCTLCRRRWHVHVTLRPAPDPESIKRRKIVTA